MFFIMFVCFFEWVGVFVWVGRCLLGWMRLSLCLGGLVCVKSDTEYA